MILLRSHKIHRGFTIIELLVVGSVFSIITTVIALLFTRGASVYRHSETHIEMQRAGRNITARVAPYVNSMFNAVPPSSSAVLIPASADPNNPSTSLGFRTTEDWLGAGYPSVDTTSKLANSTADLGTFTYEIRLDGDKNIVLQRLDPANLAVVTDSLVLRRHREGLEIAETVDENQVPFGFALVRANLLVMQFTLVQTTWSEAHIPIELKETFRITFNLPTKSV